MLAESTSIDTFSGFWSAIENAKGTTDKELCRYVVIGFSEKTELLTDICSLFKKLIQRNPDFSEGERKIGKRIVSKLETLAKESKNDWNKVIPLWKRWTTAGLEDPTFGYEHGGQILKQMMTVKIKKYIEEYTENQWNVVLPDIPFPHEIVSSYTNNCDDGRQRAPSDWVKRRLEQSKTKTEV